MPATCSSRALSFLPVCRSKNITTAIAHKKNGNVYSCNARWLNVTQCGDRTYAVIMHIANTTILPRMRSLSVASLFCILFTHTNHIKSPKGIEHLYNRGEVQNKKSQRILSGTYYLCYESNNFMVISPGCTWKQFWDSMGILGVI
jgi:hypothetical protein